MPNGKFEQMPSPEEKPERNIEEQNIEEQIEKVLREKEEREIKELLEMEPKKQQVELGKKSIGELTDLGNTTERYLSKTSAETLRGMQEENKINVEEEEQFSKKTVLELFREHNSSKEDKREIRRIENQIKESAEDRGLSEESSKKLAERFFLEGTIIDPHTFRVQYAGGERAKEYGPAYQEICAKEVLDKLKIENPDILIQEQLLMQLRVALLDKMIATPEEKERLQEKMGRLPTHNTMTKGTERGILRRFKESLFEKG